MNEGDNLDAVALRFPIEELRQLGFDPSPLPSPETPLPPSYVPPAADYATPWRVADYGERVIVLDSEGASLFEVFPGQVRGYVATRKDRRAIAEHIVEAVNKGYGDGYVPVFITRQVAAAAARRAVLEAEHDTDHHRAADDGNPHHGDD